MRQRIANWNCQVQYVHEKMEVVDITDTEMMAAMKKIPVEWRTGLIIPIWKMKGDVHDPGKYRGITLLSQVLKLLERVFSRWTDEEEN